MIRGRHRGLPVAIDRAVMFPPKEYPYGDGGEDDGEDHDGASDAALGENGDAIAEEKSVNGDPFDLRQRRGSRLDEEDEISLHSFHPSGDANGSANPN